MEYPGKVGLGLLLLVLSVRLCDAFANNSEVASVLSVTASGVSAGSADFKGHWL